MTRTIQCPHCQVELTIPAEAGSKRLRCPKCSARFYPPGARPAASSRPPSQPGPGSSILAESVEPRRPSKKVKVPPSSGQQPARGHAGLPPSPGDLRDLMDVPLVDDGPDLPFAPSSGAADAAALFRDDPPPPRSRRPAAEARRESRPCPSCGAIVPRGMSLCGLCGLDLDTGRQYPVEEEPEEAPPPPIDAGAPTSVLLIGLISLVASLTLAGLSIVRLEGIGRLCLVPVCLFGVLGAIHFLQGRSMKPLVVALMLGGAVDIVALIVVPILLDDVAVPPPAVAAEAQRPRPHEADADADADEADPGETPSTPIANPLVERIDTTKLYLGIAVLILDAVMLISLSAPGVTRYFDRRHRYSSEAGEIIL